VKLDEVPQDASPTYAGHKKLLYATTADGEYCTAQSSGWEAEAFATELAVAELQQLAEQAYQRWSNGLASPLLFLMYQARLDDTGLSQITGLWRWRIRRHFQLQHYRKLSVRILQRYSAALDVSLAQLQAYQQE
jgi:glucan biosynthesis protein